MPPFRPFLSSFFDLLDWENDEELLNFPMTVFF